MPRDGEHGDAIIFSTDWPAQDWDRHKSWYDAWQWLGGHVVARTQPLRATTDSRQTKPSSA